MNKGVILFMESAFFHKGWNNDFEGICNYGHHKKFILIWNNYTEKNLNIFSEETTRIWWFTDIHWWLLEVLYCDLMYPQSREMNNRILPQILIWHFRSNSHPTILLKSIDNFKRYFDMYTPPIKGGELSSLFIQIWLKSLIYK